MSEATKQPERKKYELKLDEHYPFNAIGEFKLLSSTELARLAYPIFKAAFADFEGLIFEPNNGNPSYSMLFNHGKYEDDEVVGVKRSVDGKSNSDNVLDRTRIRDNMIKNGDRYLITDDLKDVIERLLTPQAFNNGNPKWGGIVSEYVENRGGYYFAQNTPQYTKVSNISMSRLASLLFGRKAKKENSDEYDIYDYEVRPLGSLGMTMAGVPSQEYMLQITKASTNEVNETYRKLGFSTISSNIIRG